MIKDLLDFHSVELTEKDLNITKFSLHSLIDETISLFDY